MNTDLLTTYLGLTRGVVAVAMTATIAPPLSRLWWLGLAYAVATAIAGYLTNKRLL